LKFLSGRFHFSHAVATSGDSGESKDISNEARKKLKRAFRPATEKETFFDGCRHRAISGTDLSDVALRTNLFPSDVRGSIGKSIRNGRGVVVREHRPGFSTAVPDSAHDKPLTVLLCWINPSSNRVRCVLSAK